MIRAEIKTVTIPLWRCCCWYLCWYPRLLTENHKILYDKKCILYILRWLLDVLDTTDERGKWIAAATRNAYRARCVDGNFALITIISDDATRISIAEQHSERVSWARSEWVLEVRVWAIQDSKNARPNYVALGDDMARVWSTAVYGLRVELSEAQVVAVGGVKRERGLRCGRGAWWNELYGSRYST